MVPPRGDDVVLSRGDVVLRRSDLDILDGPHYINDRIIEFFFDDLSSDISNQDILFLPPSISFLIANCPDDDESLKDAVEPLKLPEWKIIVCTVNDNDDVTAIGGHHWSLLAYSRAKNLFIHHDSMGRMNRSHAQKLSERLAGFLGSPGSPAGFVEGDTPRQENGYDCGLFVIAIAKLIVQWHLQGPNPEDLWVPLVMGAVNSSTVSQMRKKLLSNIKHLMAQK